MDQDVFCEKQTCKKRSFGVNTSWTRDPFSHHSHARNPWITRKITQPVNCISDSFYYGLYQCPLYTHHTRPYGNLHSIPKYPCHNIKFHFIIQYPGHMSMSVYIPISQSYINLNYIPQYLSHMSKPFYTPMHQPFINVSYMPQYPSHMSMLIIYTPNTLTMQRCQLYTPIPWSFINVNYIP